MVIKILGIGCPKCKKLEANVKNAITQAGISATVEKVTNMDDILKYNVVMIPGLVVDEEVKSCGKVLTVEQIRNIITS